MRLRPVLIIGAVMATAVAVPSAGAAPAKRPVPISYTASATPDPTSTNALTNEICVPTVPTAVHKHTFKVPGRGVLKLALNNTLDWSVAIRSASGSTLVASDGTEVTDKEVVALRFKRATTISIDTCNFAGEPSIEVTGSFTFT